MEVKLDGTINPELKDYLLSQEGITNVEINYDDCFIKLDIKLNEKANPNIVMQYIELFGEYKNSNLVEFNKESKEKTKELKYIVDGMYCEYCYMDLVRHLFENDRIKAVKSDFDFNNPFNKAEVLIEYDEKYDKEDLIKYIKEKYN